MWFWAIGNDRNDKVGMNIQAQLLARVTQNINLAFPTTPYKWKYYRLPIHNFIKKSIQQFESTFKSK